MLAAEVQDSNGEVLVNFVTLLKIKGKLLRFFIPEGGKFLNICSLINSDHNEGFFSHEDIVI